MKKILFSIGFVLFLGLMLFNVKSDQVNSNPNEIVTLLKLEELNVLAAPRPCWNSMWFCTDEPICFPERWCADCDMYDVVLAFQPFNC